MQELEMQQTAVLEPGGDCYQLSPQQRHVWLARLEWQSSEHPFYVRCVVHIEGELRRSLLQRAVSQVIARHEILRTSFECPPEMEMPVQVIRALPPGENGHNGATSHCWKFDSGSLEATLREENANFHLLDLTLPAICSDRAGMRNVLREIVSSYSSLIDESRNDDEDPLQYVDLSQWFNDLLDQEETRLARDYWRRLELSPALLVKLPSNEPQTSENSRFTPRIHRLRLETQLSARLASLAEHLEESVSNITLTCWLILLHRLTQRDHLGIGVFFNGRKFEGLDALPGLFGRHLPLVSRFSERETFRELLSRVGEAASKHAQRQEYFLWEDLEPEDDGQSSRYFPHTFEFVDAPSKYEVASGCFRIMHEAACLDRCDISLICTALEDDGLALEFQYDATKYSGAEIASLGERFELLLTSVVINPDAEAGRLEIVGPRERNRLLFEWNQTETEYPGACCLHELFEQQVTRTPDCVALVYEGEYLSYAELNSRANRLANYLHATGVGPEVRVGVMMERSVEMVLAMYGILKAGGAYVPLDPSYPQERRAYMQQDSGIEVLLTQSSLLASLPDTAGLRVIALDLEWQSIASSSDSNPSTGVTPDSLAYVIYTSGSTGKPKGVMVTHASVDNFLRWMQETYELDHADRVMLKSPLNFDPSVWELFWPLMLGASVVLARPGGHMEPAYLIQLIKQENVTTIHFVPSVAQVFLSTAGVETCSPRRMVCGGEALPPGIARQFFQFFPDGELHNSYGPTETTIAPTDWKCSADDARLSNIPIGRPIANSQIYLLDSYLNPIPAGIPGELCAGGASLARGYLNRPELTAQKFIPNPYGGNAGGRLYRTGDLARQRVDGVIEFLGRIDHQVKIRGNRVELGEIEAVLAGHVGVREALVMLRDGPDGEARLVAYVVDSKDVSLTTVELREHLKKKLPDYMVPASIILLDEMPLGANGKIDRNALPLSEPERVQGREESRHLFSPIEEMLAGIWTEVLGIRVMDPNDNFFDLGGHSLMVMQVATRVREIFQVELPLRVYFDDQTIRRLAAQIESMSAADSSLKRPPLLPSSRKERIPLSFAQQRLWFLDQLQPGVATYNLPIGVRLMGPLDVEALERSISEVVRRHQSLRTVFAQSEGQPVQVICDFEEINLPIVDLTIEDEATREAELRRLLENEARRPFDLASGPLLRATLFRVATNDHAILMNLHHVISDGWSNGVLLREMCALYEAFVEGRDAQLKDLPVQYADFARWQREWLRDEVLEAQLGYWKSKLDGVSPLALPTDRPRPAIYSTRGARRSFGLSSELAEQIHKLSSREGVTVFMTLLAAFQVLLMRLSGQTDISVGTPVANRNHKETENLIGFFVNTLVLRTNFDGDPTFRDLLKRVREVALGAYSYQDIPFEMLVEELRPLRSLSRTPLFQVMFSMQTTTTQARNITGLSLSPLGLDSQTSKFDLTLFMDDSPLGLSGSVEYNADLFDETTIKRWLHYFGTLLEECIAEPDRHLSELQLLDAAGREEILIHWNETQKFYPRPHLLHRLFEEQVELTPEAVAVIFEEQELSYRELNRRANRLANHLRALGVRAEDLVGVCVERSAELVWALLGVLKAGGAYVPLDPTYPQERLDFILADTQVPVVLTQKHLLEKMSHHPAVICVEDESTFASDSPDNLSVEIAEDQLAYVIYTSGSTGNPKGVMNTHRAICNRLLWMQDAYQLTEVDRVMQKTSFTFDVSVWEFFWPLIDGATLIVARPGGHQDSDYLVNLIRKHNVTVMHFVPSMLKVFVEEPEVEHCRSLRLIVSSGEELTVELLERFFARLDSGFENLYGPTEAAVDVSFWTCGRDGGMGFVPIGKPIANVQLYLLDHQLQPVIVGAIGELYIGGVALARGYNRRSALTAEKFIPHPFSSEPGARLYYTGDLARFLPDGNIQYLGRTDSQVKLRGFRIELGEIETVLRKQPGVSEAVVLAREDVPGDKYLAAYLITESPETLDLRLVRARLGEQLPNYMIPTAFVILDDLPLSTAGKINRRVLPKPDGMGFEPEADYVPPRSEAEEQIAAVWREVLGVDRVGANDNFFDLGGHSLKMATVHARLREIYTRELTMLNLFEYPTVMALARFITGEDLDETLEDSRSRAQTRKNFSPRQGHVLGRREARLRVREAFNE